MANHLIMEHKTFFYLLDDRMWWHIFSRNLHEGIVKMGIERFSENFEVFQSLRVEDFSELIEDQLQPLKENALVFTPVITRGLPRLQRSLKIINHREEF